MPLRRPRLDKRLADEARFLKSWIDNPLVAGAVAPSSRFLADAMARAIDPLVVGPIVELGPGTGPVTQALLARGLAPERLVLVEYDPTFCDLLARRFPGVRVVEGDAYDLPGTLAGALDARPGAVVSSLPLLNRPELARLRLLADAFNLMRPEGRFIQFTYGMVSPIPRRVGGRPIDWFEAAADEPVWLNLPPARVWVYRRPDARRPILGPAPLAGRLAERRERLQATLREKTRRLEADLREATERMEAGLREAGGKVETELRGAADKVRVELRETTRKLQGELRETASRMRDELRELKERTDRLKAEFESEWRDARRRLGARIAGVRPKPARRRKPGKP